MAQFLPKGEQAAWKMVVEGFIDKHGPRPPAGTTVTFDEIAGWLGVDSFPKPTPSGFDYSPMPDVKRKLLEAHGLWLEGEGDGTYRVLSDDQKLVYVRGHWLLVRRRLKLLADISASAVTLHGAGAQARDALRDILDDEVKEANARDRHLRRQVRFFGGVYGSRSSLKSVEAAALADDDEAAALAEAEGIDGLYPDLDEPEPLES